MFESLANFLTHGELERFRNINNELKESIKYLKSEKERLEKINKGERTCTELCEHCAHGKKRNGFSPICGQFPTWDCMLDVKCKDFKKKE